MAEFVLAEDVVRPLLQLEGLLWRFFMTQLASPQFHHFRMLFVLALSRAIFLIVRLLEKPEGRRQGHVDLLVSRYTTAELLAVLYYLGALVLKLLKISSALAKSHSVTHLGPHQ